MTEHICPPGHKHAGNSTCYTQHKCRCGECREHRRVTAAAWRRQVAYGRRVARRDPAPVVAHILALRDAGWTWGQLVQATGVHKRYLLNLLHHTPGWVLSTTETKILAVGGEPGRLWLGQVDGTGSRRRLQALVARGWTVQQLADRLGRDITNVHRFMTHDVGCTERTRVEVAAVYDELWAVDVPAGFARSRAISLARKYGWVGPLAWDDDTIDDPTVDPAVDAPSAPWKTRLDEDTVLAAIAGERPQLAPRERREVVRRLWCRRWSDQRIASHIGGSSQQVLRIRDELDLHAWEIWEMETAA